MLKRLFGRSAKTHTVQVEPFGATLTVGAKETILMAALKAGLPFLQRARCHPVVAQGGALRVRSEILL